MMRADSETGGRVKRGTSGGAGGWLVWLIVTAVLLIAWGSSAWWQARARAWRVGFECGSGAIGAGLAAEPGWSVKGEWGGGFSQFQWLPRVSFAEPDPGVSLPGWILVLAAGGMAGLGAWRGRRPARREQTEPSEAAAKPRAEAAPRQAEAHPAPRLRSRASSKPDKCPSCGGDTTDAALAADGSVTCPACGHAYKASYAEIVARTRRRKKADG